MLRIYNIEFVKKESDFQMNVNSLSNGLYISVCTSLDTGIEATYAPAVSLCMVT